jgi:hypothetical protein
MSITFLQLSKNREGFAGYLEGPEHGNIMVKMASAALDLNKTRVQERGIGSNGEKYRPYSTKPMLSGSKNMTKSAFNSIAGNKTKRAELDWVTIGGSSGFSSYLAVSSGTSSGMANSGKGVHLFVIPGGYKQFRELHNRKTGFVNFTFYNRMWNNIKLVSDRAELNSGVAVLRPTEDIEKKKLAGNTERRGEILGLSKKEEERLSDIYSVWVEGALKKYKLA